MSFNLQQFSSFFSTWGLYGITTERTGNINTLSILTQMAIYGVFGCQFKPPLMVTEPMLGLYIYLAMMSLAKELEKSFHGPQTSTAQSMTSQTKDIWQLQCNAVTLKAASLDEVGCNSTYTRPNVYFSYA